MTGLQPAGLSHSDTCGSSPVCRSPHIFAAYRVLRRRQKPRHPPFALCNFSCCESYLLTIVRRYVLFLLYEKVVPNFLQTIFSDFLPLSFLSQYFNELCNLLQWQPGYRSPFFCVFHFAYIYNEKTSMRKLFTRYISSKKEVFQPHLPVRLPCYDLAPVTSFALGRPSRSRTSGTPSFHGLTGGVYKARERIHRAMADARLLANPTSWSRVADSNPN